MNQVHVVPHVSPAASRAVAIAKPLLLVAGGVVIGLLALVVGLFVTIPLSFLAMTHAYRTLAKGTPEAESAAA